MHRGTIRRAIGMSKETDRVRQAGYQGEPWPVHPRDINEYARKGDPVDPTSIIGICYAKGREALLDEILSRVIRIGDAINDASNEGFADQYDPEPYRRLEAKLLGLIKESKKCRETSTRSKM
jgi:hypothetical protein